MKTTCKHIILIFTAILLLITGVLGDRSAYAAHTPDTSNASEAALLDLINTARKYPLGMAEFFGMDRKQIINDFPEMADILKGGLPELNMDPRLDQTAKAHGADMLENGYYAYEALDGRDVAQRMADSGYAASDAGESLGMIAFNNFLNPQKAVYQIFENIYRNELNPDYQGQRNILNPDLKDVGISFKGGVFQFDRYTANAYLVVCDFGMEAELHDLQLAQLINQARAYPLAVANAYNKNLDAFFEMFPEYLPIMEDGLPALEFNRNIYKAATAHTADMLENQYVRHVSIDGRTPAMRLEENGYASSWLAESIYRMPVFTDDDSEMDVVDVPALFNLMFNGAFRTEGWQDRNLFSETAVDIGVSLVHQFSATGSIVSNDFQLAVIDYAAKNAEEALGIIGTIYADSNANGLYDAGEEISGALVSVRSDSGFEKQVVANPAGGFSVTASPGHYNIEVRRVNDEKIAVARKVSVGTSGKWIGLRTN